MRNNILQFHYKIIFQGIMSGFARVEFADELEKFFRQNDGMTAKNAVQQSLESIRLNVGQLARDGKAIVDYINEIL